ncbi:lysosomal enzyme trafficking factor isoform X1 [Myripristis murdjan]|uniref:lysosomal enzyme trafficking factor isoform X1 n=1 Tax=Myripristis murdjan TaxID=586833 RepID=UPI0011761782|nr:transmembrane protein 251 isoform X1 [Myripristis murdjan]
MEDDELPVCVVGGAWRMMNFRQRMAWLCVCVYLLLSVLLVFLLFDGRSFSLEHVAPARPSAAPGGPSWAGHLRARLLLLPLWAWAGLLLLPYLQVFLCLYSCTRAEPRALGYCLLPVCLALLCSRHAPCRTPANQSGRTQLIDT